MDEDYISAESVYDRTQGKTQSEINAQSETGLTVYDGRVEFISGYNSIVKKQGNIVIISFFVRTLKQLAATDNALFTIPTEYRPVSTTCIGTAMNAGTFVPYQLTVGTTGYVNVIHTATTIASGQYLTGFITYII